MDANGIIRYFMPTAGVLYLDSKLKFGMILALVLNN